MPQRDVSLPIIIRAGHQADNTTFEYTLITLEETGWRQYQPLPTPK